MVSALTVSIHCVTGSLSQCSRVRKRNKGIDFKEKNKTLLIHYRHDFVYIGNSKEFTK